jgi:hypothetical protein
VIQETEREAERRAEIRARHEQRLWRGSRAYVVHLIMAILAWSRLNLLIAVLARLAGLHLPRLTEIDVPVADLPPALAGLRIGHLSDLHVGPLVRSSDARRAVALLQAAAPDLIVLTGDLLDHRPRDIVPVARALADLSAPLGVFGVLGNHDHRVGAGLLLAALSEHSPNIRILINSAHAVSVGSTTLWIAGLDSAYLFLSDAEAALARVSEGAPCLLLSHEPDIADRLPRPVSLILAGHAHGGQIRLGGRPLMLPPLGRRYPDGLRRSDAGPVYTSRGVGWTGLPLRIDCPPEVAVLRLVPAGPAPGRMGAHS